MPPYGALLLTLTFSDSSYSTHSPSASFPTACSAAGPGQIANPSGIKKDVGS